MREGKTAIADAIEEYIATYPPDLQAIIRALRAVTSAAMPGAQEFVYHAALNYGLTASPSERHCYIAPQAKGYVNLGFFIGAQLPDPERLLVGEGARMRHVKVKSADDARNPALLRLIVASWASAPASIAALRAGRRRTRV